MISSKRIKYDFFDIAAKPVAELKEQLPRIATILNVPVDELAIIDFSNWELNQRDQVIGTYGQLDGMPLIQSQRYNVNSNIGTGIVIYENRIDKSIKYALTVISSKIGVQQHLVVPKNKVFALKRNYSKINKKLNSTNQIPILADGLLEEVIQDTVGFLLKSDSMKQYGIKLTRGLILDGSPGNGKTMLCKYIQQLCTEKGISWGVVTSAEIDSAYQDKYLNGLFQMFAVTFFDDIDVAYMDRKQGNGKMACSLLTAMDGMYDRNLLVRIFTTNESVSELDPAFTRPGRIDKCITLQKPNSTLRQKLIDTVWPKSITDHIDVNYLIKKSEGFSFAELESIRTFLVINKTSGNCEWDLNKALQQFEFGNNQKKKQTKTGFK